MGNKINQRKNFKRKLQKVKRQLMANCRRALLARNNKQADKCDPVEPLSRNLSSTLGSPLQIIGDIVIEHDNYEMEFDDENPTIDHVQKPRQTIEVRLNKAPKTSAERGREFRARKALLKQQSKQQQVPNAIVEIATEDIRGVGPSEDSQVPRPCEIRTIEKRAKSAEATRRWREKKKGVSKSSKKQAKTAAQRMREYRERKKL